jgi:Tfp pilus assembly ATPase PilU
MEFEDLLKIMVQKGGSDMFITAGVPPSVKLNGKVVPITKTPLSPEMTREVVLGVMTEQHAKSSHRARNATLPFLPVASAASVFRLTTSAILSAWCCAVSKPIFPRWMI